MNRIMWNQRGKSIDEIVLKDVKLVHIEQMDDHCWWIGIDLANGGYWAGNFMCPHDRSKTPMTFTEQEMLDFEWDDDGSHDEYGKQPAPVPHTFIVRTDLGANPGELCEASCVVCQETSGAGDLEFVQTWQVEHLQRKE